MARTNATAVQTILGTNYGAFPDGTLPDLSPYIELATAIMDRVEECAIEKDRPLTAVQLELMERWVAAHYYTVMDPLYKARTTADGSGTFHELTYLHGALALDSSGCLASAVVEPEDIASRPVAGGFWLGKPPSEQIDYQDRD